MKLGVNFLPPAKGPSSSQSWGRQLLVLQEYPFPYFRVPCLSGTRPRCHAKDALVTLPSLLSKVLLTLRPWATPIYCHCPCPTAHRRFLHSDLVGSPSRPPRFGPCQSRPYSESQMTKLFTGTVSFDTLLLPQLAKLRQ